MKLSSEALLLAVASFWSCSQTASAFLATPTAPTFSKPTPLFSMTEEETKTDVAKTSSKHAATPGEIDPDAEGLPWWWELVWDLDMMKKGEAGKPIIFGDTCNVLRTNIEQIYGGYPSMDGCPLAGMTSASHLLAVKAEIPDI